jgi:single-stranded DNA-binding protein
MPNVNKVILMGVLGRDPETKTFPMVAVLPLSALQLLSLERQDHQ